MNNPEKLATYSTQDTGQINVREHRRGNQQWTIQRNWRHIVHKTQDKYTLENTEGEIKMNNPEKLATYSTQDTGQINVREHRRENQEEQSKETGHI